MIGIDYLSLQNVICFTSSSNLTCWDRKRSTICQINNKAASIHIMIPQIRNRRVSFMTWNLKKIIILKYWWTMRKCVFRLPTKFFPTQRTNSETLCNSGIVIVRDTPDWYAVTAQRRFHGQKLNFWISPLTKQSSSYRKQQTTHWSCSCMLAVF